MSRSQFSPPWPVVAGARLAEDKGVGVKDLASLQKSTEKRRTTRTRAGGGRSLAGLRGAVMGSPELKRRRAVGGRKG